MKLSRFISILLIITALFALTGCEEILAAIGGEEIFGDDDTYESSYIERPNISVVGNEVDFTLRYGETKSFSVSATVEDGGTLSYQWYKNTKSRYETENVVAIDGAVSPTFTYTAPNAEVAKTYYSCKVTNTKNGKSESNWSYAVEVIVSNIIVLDGTTISEVTPWNPAYTYYVKSWAVVEKSLTIPAGTVVKFGKDAYLETSGSGTITVQAEDGKTTYFTSYLDMTQGIVIPEFAGTVVQPAKGDWRGVSINGASGSAFKNCVFRYSNDSALRLYAKTNVENCAFTDNKSVQYSGALTIYDSANESVVKNNFFFNNDWPLYVAATYSVDTSNIFHNPLNAEEKNSNQAIIMYGGVDIAQGKSVNWKVSELPYFVAEGTWVAVYGHLYIGDAVNNVIVKFNKGYYLDVLDTGTLSLGSGSILTCWKDDEHGGDIEGDGSIECDDGDWEGVCFPEGGYNNPINKDSTRVFYNDKSRIEE